MVVCSTKCIVASIYDAVLGWFQRSYASGDLGMFAKRGKTVVAPNALCLADHPVLCIGALAAAGEETITANPKGEKNGETPGSFSP